MSTVFGFTGNKYDLESIQKKLDHWESDRSSLYRSDKINIGVLELFKTPECHLTAQPLKRDHVVVSLDGRLDNRDELLVKLSLSVEKQFADVDLVAESFMKWGEKCVNHLIGDFVISVWDERTKSLFVARDQMGVKPVYYALIDNDLVYSSEIKGIIAVSQFEKKINERYVVSLFSSFQIKREETLYQNLLKLPAGHYLTFKDNELVVHEYWYLGINAPAIPESVEEQVKRFGELFNQSVKDRLRSAGNLGAEVSGGLDSTGIAAFAMSNLGDGIPFYSYCYGKANESVSEHDKKDDSALVEEFCDKYQISKYLTITNELDLSGEDYLKYYHEILDEIDRNGVPLLSTSFLPKAQKDEVNVMLSGWAGDQVVTSTASGFYSAKANKKMYRSLWTELKGNFNTKDSFIRFVYYNLNAVFKPFYKQNLKKSRKGLKFTVLKNDLIKKYKLNEIPNLRYYLKSCTSIREYQKVNVTHAGIEGRTVDHGLIGKHFKIDYRFPMLDIRLLEYVHHLPFTTTAPKGETRFLFKQLIKGKVPDEVVNLHKSKVPTTPFGKAFFEKNKDYFAEELNKFDLNSFEFLRKDNKDILNKKKEVLLQLCKKIK